MLLEARVACAGASVIFRRMDIWAIVPLSHQHIGVRRLTLCVEGCTYQMIKTILFGDMETPLVDSFPEGMNLMIASTLKENSKRTQSKLSEVPK